MSDGGTRIVEEYREIFQGSGVEINFAAARIFDFGSARAVNTIDRAENVGLPELGGRATKFVPAAGINYEQRAVGIFDDVGGMKIGLIGNEKI
jgi:hypothetical protein